MTLTPESSIRDLEGALEAAQVIDLNLYVEDGRLAGLAVNAKGAKAETAGHEHVHDAVNALIVNLVG